jgi:hypothetical protein
MSSENHVYHAFHHNLTTNSPSGKHHFSKNPLKNTRKIAKNSALNHPSFF